MRVIVLLLSVFAATIGALAIFAPDWANRLARMFFDRLGFHVTTVTQLVLGTGLLVLAETRHAPRWLSGFSAQPSC